MKWVREGNGPYILEMLTYRYRGHSMSDPAKYRTREEVQKMREEHDPIEQVRRRVLEGRLVSEEDMKAIDAEVRATVNAAAEFAQSRSRAGRERALYGRAAAGLRRNASFSGVSSCPPASPSNLDEEFAQLTALLLAAGDRRAPMARMS